jgi:uncharacterized membrane protein YeaQ/YmgE (transglycosylase-associated protein family)
MRRKKVRGFGFGSMVAGEMADRWSRADGWCCFLSTISRIISASWHSGCFIAERHRFISQNAAGLLHLIEGKSSEILQEYVMGIIAWIVLGLIAGFVASKLVNKSGEGFLGDVVLGIIGAVVGGFVASMVGATGVTGFNIYSMMVAVVGAVICLVIYHAVIGRRNLR